MFPVSLQGDIFLRRRKREAEEKDEGTFLQTKK